MNVITDLEKKGLICPPKWLPSAVQYLTVMGSTAYGVANDSSDYDVYGFAVPSKEDVFPHLKGEILGFGQHTQRFDQYQQHHVVDPSERAGRGRTYDISIFSIVKYFQLCMENNPNMIDSLFTPINCVLYSSEIGERVREHRRMFLHKGAWPRFKGYAYSQRAKLLDKTVKKIVDFERRTGTILSVSEADALLTSKNWDGEKLGLTRAELTYYRDLLSVSGTSSRLAMVREHGFDIKMAYHIVRLMNEVEQILEEGDLDLQRNKEQLKSIRRGEWTLSQIDDFFEHKQVSLTKLYEKSRLPYKPDEPAIKKLLLECLEIKYGNVANAITLPDAGETLLQEIHSKVFAYFSSRSLPG